MDTFTKFQKVQDGRLARIDMVKHPIELTTPDGRFINYALYSTGPNACKLEKVEIDNMLCMKVIEPGKSEWASPIVLAWKGMDRSGSVSTTDNAGTVKDAYPIQQMHEYLDSLGKARILAR